MKNSGVTLVELLIVIAIIGIIAALVTIDTGWFQKDARLTEARDKLLADIEEIKLKSITTVPHGIIVSGSTSTSYAVVQLKDYRCSNSDTTACLEDSDCTSPGTCTVTGNLKRDTGEAYATIVTQTVSSNAKIKVNLGGGTELWFDRKGVPRTSSWATLGREFTVWYDDDEDNDFASDSTSDEPRKTITISVAGRVKYEQ